MTGTALVLGGSGRFGRNMTQALAKAGWNIRLFDRARGRLPCAAMGTQLIVNGWNPAYPDWEAQVPAQTQKVIEAAEASGATVLLPGNVYVFGTGGVWSERTPHRASNPLGLIRARMENAYRQSGVQTILLRAGDFIDTEASGNWFDQMLIKSLDRDLLTYPGDPAIPHSWAYLPDVARAAVRLAEIRHDLPTFLDVPFPGYTVSGDDLRDGLSRVTGRPVRLKRMAWWPLQAVSPFWPLGRRLLEMRYLWNTPHSLDGRLFDHLLSTFEHTALDTALGHAIIRT